MAATEDPENILTSLDASMAALKAEFNGGRGLRRLVALMSPT